MIIIMTGATSGIGAEALKHFATLPDTTVYIGARGNQRIVPEGIEVLPLDLSSLKSVRSFADNIKQRLDDTKIDTLVLNAGIQATDNKQRSEEGFELTFATNHLAHYLLVRLILPNMAKGGKIVITTSDSHDPEIIFFGPKTLDLKELAYPNENSPKGMRFYAATKLCNLLTARSLSAISLKDDRGISVIAYNPGFTGDTSLGGKQSSFLKLLLPIIIRPLFRFISIFKSAFYMGTAKRSGEALTELALGKVKVPADKIYASLIRGKLTFPNPSQLARDNNTKDLAWKESAKMVGLPE